MDRRILIGSLIAILGLMVWSFVFVSQMPAMKNKPAATPQLQVPDNMGGPFTLTNQDGEKVSTTVFKGKHKLVYFGFTHCPAICPTELQKIAQAMKLLGDQSAQIQPLFISVDPERDTPAVLKDYVPLFDMGLVGFTGSKAEVEAVKRQYRVYAAKVDDPNASEYAVDHSSYIYFLDENDKVIDLFKTEDTAKVIAERVGKTLSAQ